MLGFKESHVEEFKKKGTRQKHIQSPLLGSFSTQKQRNEENQGNLTCNT